MLVPIAVNDPAEVGNNKEVWIVGYAAFYITQHDSNSHNARLISNYLVTGPSEETWCRECDSGVAVIRLTA